MSEDRITFRLPADMHHQLKAWAEREHRSVNNQLLYLLKNALKPSEPYAWKASEYPPGSKPLPSSAAYEEWVRDMDEPKLDDLRVLGGTK